MTGLTLLNSDISGYLDVERLVGKRILLGVTGGIAAYKAAELVRRLCGAGAEVRVVMTRAAGEFVTSLTFQALSGNPVHHDLLDTEAEAAMGHIELARWGDALLVAPATADFMARLVQGRGDDLLGALCLATPAPILVAPAMNQGMWGDPATQRNLATLLERGVQVLGPAEGSQACGDVGPGRMLEAEQLVVALAKTFQTGLLTGHKVVITAGPTRERIDPVRYLSNDSSGKMGFALAEAAAEAGAEVVLVAGPVALPAPPRVRRLDVCSALEMRDAAMAAAQGASLFIAAAAVADFRPCAQATTKIKKRDLGAGMTLELTPNPDVVAEVAASGRAKKVVGFAAETDNLVTNARQKLEAKGLDLVVGNDVSAAGIGFNGDDNAVVLVDRQGERELPRASKALIARGILQAAIALLVDGPATETEKAHPAPEVAQR